MPKLEQIKAKRTGTGLKGWDEERAFQGYTLFAPVGGSIVYLIAMDGSIVHSWQMPYTTGNYGYITERGTLFYNGCVPEESDRYISTQPWKGGVALEADWNGNILWEVRHPDHKHDGRRLQNGNVILMCITQLPQEIAARVRGGLPGTEHHGEIFADYLVEMTTDGRIVWEWRSWEHLDPNEDVLTAAQEPRHEWTHGNSVAELPNGDLVVSYRTISTVIIIDRATGNIRWKLGAPPLSHQHAPTPLANGNLLIFDNGTHRVDERLPFSRVIEVDVATKEIVWKYQERRPMDFYSPNISNAQRLPNGNTLICEGAFGRFFEVTTNGEVVWEYINPYFNPPKGQPQGPLANSVFRAYRYSAEEIERARATAR